MFRVVRAERNQCHNQYASVLTLQNLVIGNHKMKEIAVRDLVS